VDDLFNEFLGYDFCIGADVVKCPHCGKDAPCSLFFDDDEIECSECGEQNKKSERIVMKQILG